MLNILRRSMEPDVRFGTVFLLELIQARSGGFRLPMAALARIPCVYSEPVDAGRGTVKLAVAAIPSSDTAQSVVFVAPDKA